MADWSHLFVSRERELEELQEAYRQVVNGRTKVVAIVGDPGFGKTRLVQEFYRWLATRDKGEHCNNGYWPDQQLNQSLVPDIKKCGVKTHRMPYLWLGLRLVVDPVPPENVPDSALSNAYDILKRYLGTYDKFNRREENAEKTKQALSKEILGLIGPVAGPFNMIFAVRDYFQVERYLNQQDCQPAAVLQRNRDVQSEILLNWFFQLAKKPPEEFSPIPLVIILDDVQWLAHDDGMATFMSKLIQRGRKEGWPLLVVVTCWKTEWNKSSQAVILPASLFDQAQGDVTLTLAQVARLEQIIETAFPGLTSDQCQAITAQVEGNPRFLNEVLRELQGSEGYFVGNDFGAALTSDGLTEITKWEYPEFLAQRFKNSPKNIKQALVLASTQGRIIFSRRIVEYMAVNLRLDVKDVLTGLEQSDNPYGFITLENGANGGEFILNQYYNVAVDNQKNHLKNADVKKAQRSARKSVVADIHRADERELEWVFNTGSSNQVRKTGVALIDIAKARHDLRTTGIIAKTLLERSSNFGNSADLSAICACTDAYVAWYGLKQPVIEVLGQRLNRVRGKYGKTPKTELRREIIILLGRLGSYLIEFGKPDEAQPFLEESIRLARALVDEHNTPNARFELSVVLSKGGCIIDSLKGADEALPLFEESLELARSLADEQNTPDIRRRLINALYDFAKATFKLKGIDKARPFFEESMDLARALANEQMSARNISTLGVTIFNVGRVISSIGEEDWKLRSSFEGEAKSLIRESLELFRVLVNKENSSKNRYSLSVALATLAIMSSEKSLYKESLELAHSLVDEQNTIIHLDHLSIVLFRFVHLIYCRDDREEARPLFKVALDLSRAISENYSEDAQRALNGSLPRLADIAEDLSEPEIACALRAEMRFIIEDLKRAFS